LYPKGSFLELVRKEIRQVTG